MAEVDRTQHDTPSGEGHHTDHAPPQDVPTDDSFSAALQHSMRVFSGEADAEEVPGETAAPPGAPQPDTPAPTPRFATQEEAERAHREAEQRMHQSTQEAASLRRYVETLELRLRDLEAHPGHPGAEQPHAQPAAAPQPLNIRERLKQAYQDASALDPDAEHYYQQQQDILVNAQAEILENLLAQPRLTEEQITQKIQQGVRQAQQDWQRQTQQQTDSARQTQKLLDAATAAGLDVRPPPDDGRGFAGLHYQDLMLAVAQDMYPADATEDQAIAHVVNLVRDRWGLQAPGTQANGINPPTLQQSARQAQTHQAPLERSGMGRPAASPQQAHPMSMSEAIEGTLRPRRPS